MARRSRGPDLAERLGALDTALEAIGDRVDAAVLDGATALRERIAVRQRLGEQVVVVALAGGTGTGKSSLFNAIAGRELSTVGARRPVTGAPVAWIDAPRGEADALLDAWGVAARHQRPGSAEPGQLDGMVLIDLPDIDSDDVANQEVADELIERVDVLVWVVDPAKYAQSSLHDGYLARLHRHAEVTLVVLNQSDRLERGRLREVRSDLGRLVGGRSSRHVVVASAVTEGGTDALRAELARVVAPARAAAARAAADVAVVATSLRTAIGVDDSASTDRLQLTAADVAAGLGDPAGLDHVMAAARREHDRAARNASRSLVLRLIALVLSPIGGVRAIARLVRGQPRPGADGALRDRRSSRGPAAASATVVRAALADFQTRAEAALAWPWAARVGATIRGAPVALASATANALAGVSTEPPRRRWWGVLAVVMSIVEVVVLLGIGWVAAVTFLGAPSALEPSVRIGEDDVGIVRLVTLAGLCVWLALVLLRRGMVSVSARRHVRRVRAQALARVAAAVETSTVAPLLAEVHAEAAARDALALASA